MMNFPAFNPRAWYWAKSDRVTIYSSASDSLVAASDAGYQAAVAATRWTPWPQDGTGAQTSAALYGVLQPYGLGASLAPPPTQAQLAGALVEAASTACDAITAQINTSGTHIAGYQNMATWVAAAGGVPTSSAYATAFANQAAAMGTTPVNLAMLIEALSAGSVSLLALLTALSAAAATATASPALATALSTFEAGIAGELATLNAALEAADLTMQIAAPAAITITGINA